MRGVLKRRGVGIVAVITCVEDLRRLHKRRVPRMFYDYAEAGSWTEATFHRNEDAFKKLQLRQRVEQTLLIDTAKLEELVEGLASGAASWSSWFST